MFKVEGLRLRKVDIRPPGIRIPMAKGQSTKIISMIEWIQASRLSTKNYVSGRPAGLSAQHNLEGQVTRFTPHKALKLIA